VDAVRSVRRARSVGVTTSAHTAKGDAGADGTAQGRGLSPHGCPSDVAGVRYSGGHAAMMARQVAAAKVVNTHVMG
jgi:hypothetical protein